MKCMKCGGEITDNSLFCNLCGVKIEFKPTEANDKIPSDLDGKSKNLKMIFAGIIILIFTVSIMYFNGQSIEQFEKKYDAIKFKETVVNSKYVDFYEKLLSVSYFTMDDYIEQELLNLEFEAIIIEQSEVTKEYTKLKPPSKLKTVYNNLIEEKKEENRLNWELSIALGDRDVRKHNEFTKKQIEQGQKVLKCSLELLDELYN